ncbi:MAG: hypothetical protein OXR66_00465 [Candidatus Woesearchaeota archaeon]|nr:hypothetical protein [Candidatus Woesearchaeota archaeon]
MSLHHRHKQRVLTTLTTLITLTIAVDAFLILRGTIGMEPALLFSFAVAIGLTTAYQCYNYRHSHEHLTLVNTLTQVFLGSILFISCLVILLIHVFLGVNIIDMYLWLSVIVIALTFIFLKKFDEFLEYEVKHRFGKSKVPSPRKRKK